MIRIWKSEIYDKFKCITSECPSNCCDEDWVITIDEETYDALSRLDFKEIDQCITSEIPHTLIKKDHKCPFITKEGLCMIHRDLGEDYLSNTCRSYPRFVSGYGDVFTQTLGLSCPEVARMVVALDHIMEVNQEFYYENKKEIGQTLPYLESEQIVNNVLGFFTGNDNVLRVFGQLSEKYDYYDTVINGSFADYLYKLRINSQIVGGQALLCDIKLDSIVCDVEDLIKINDILHEKYPYLAHNISRNYLFEHIMYLENNQERNYPKVFLKAELALMFFYSAIFAMDDKTNISSEAIRNTLYKTMRLIDHNDELLDSLI